MHACLLKSTSPQLLRSSCKGATVWLLWREGVNYKTIKSYRYFPPGSDTIGRESIPNSFYVNSAFMIVVWMKQFLRGQECASFCRPSISRPPSINRRERWVKKTWHWWNLVQTRARAWVRCLNTTFGESACTRAPCSSFCTGATKMPQDQPSWSSSVDKLDKIIETCKMTKLHGYRTNPHGVAAWTS